MRKPDRQRRHKPQRSQRRHTAALPTVERTIDGLSHEGRGVARQGKTCFVSGALPGETARVQLTAQKRRFDEGKAVEILSASPDRQAPPCPHYDDCGGCDLQHLSHPAQVRHKQQTVLEQLARQADIAPQQVLDSVSLDIDGLNYRSRARLACWYDGRRNQYHLGYRRAASREILPVETCPILVEPLARLLPALQSGLPRWNLKKRLGHLDLFLNEPQPGVTEPAVCLRLNQPPTEESREAMAAFAREQQITLAWRDDQTTETLHGHRELSYYLAGGELRLSLDWGDFSQANRVLNQRLVESAVAQLAPPPGARVLDAFCGVGNFSLALAQAGARVLGLEGNPDMVARAKDNAAQNGLDLCEFKSVDLMSEDGIGRHDLDGLHHALLDPPREGAEVLCQRLARAKDLHQLLYISCNPATFSRDAAHLKAGGFALETLQIWDMFPHSHHGELAALFSRH
ncbi:MAG: 23S rRNA (uracil(1939)-C(5))-methyltransferase RlmD [Pseudomonadota bacterium]